MTTFTIVFEDDQILVANKPAGIGTQAPRQFDSLEAQVRAHLRATSDTSHEPYLGIPHRLDRCVSGIVVFAKRKKAAQRISKQFERREVEKTYLAWVVGLVEPSSGHWTDCLRKVPDCPYGEVVTCDHPDAKQARLSYEVCGQSHAAVVHSSDAAGQDLTRLKIQLETGRMHQIRLQCAERGHSVVGDLLYGNEMAFGPEVSHDRERHIALHAEQLHLEHPKSREPILFTAPVPATWEHL